ncbi:MAG: ammonia-forming cytochrome c nitrite reductase subunit c552, partial [Desulfobacterales bacterium]|nr:ammonia-forming cytochrome c nitrite reductase subunit c552 [Desulfobacterales bacterium]
MKKPLVITIVCAFAIVGLIYLGMSINKNKAEQTALNAVAISSTADIPATESRSSEWGKYYPRQYDSYMKTKESDQIDDMLKKDP